MMQNDRVSQLKTVQNEALELFRKKNADYGDAFANYGTVGILVRLGDKISRCQSISTKSVTLVEDEKLRDTLIDLHNYAAMGIMLLDEGKEYPLDPDNEIKESHVKERTSTWIIMGSTGNKYTRERIINNNQIINTCTCPAFTYSKTKPQSCKHID